MGESAAGGAGAGDLKVGLKVFELMANLRTEDLRTRWASWCSLEEITVPLDITIPQDLNITAGARSYRQWTAGLRALARDSAFISAKEASLRPPMPLRTIDMAAENIALALGSAAIHKPTASGSRVLAKGREARKFFRWRLDHSASQRYPREGIYERATGSWNTQSTMRFSTNLILMIILILKQLHGRFSRTTQHIPSSALTNSFPPLTPLSPLGLGPPPCPSPKTHPLNSPSKNAAGTPQTACSAITCVRPLPGEGIVARKKRRPRRGARFK